MSPPQTYLHHLKSICKTSDLFVLPQTSQINLRLSIFCALKLIFTVSQTNFWPHSQPSVWTICVTLKLILNFPKNQFVPPLKQSEPPLSFNLYSYIWFFIYALDYLHPVSIYRQGNGCSHLVNWVVSNFSIYINSIHVWLLHIKSYKKSHFGKDAIFSA